MVEFSPEQYQDFRMGTLKSWLTFINMEHGQLPTPDELLKTIIDDGFHAKLWTNRALDPNLIPGDHPVYEFRGFTLDTLTRELSNPHYPEPKKLTKTENQVMTMLMANAPRFMPQEEIAHVMNNDMLSKRSQRVSSHLYISRLRELIGDQSLDSKHPFSANSFFLIRTSYGLGYSFNPIDGYEEHLK